MKRRTFNVFLLFLLSGIYAAAAARPAPWGDSYVPRSPKPAEIIRVVPLNGRNEHERIALCCLQGLIARQAPGLWLERDTVSDTFWLNQYQEKGYIREWKYAEEWKTLFKEYSHLYRGAVIEDESIYRGRLIALNVAACEDMIVTTPELAQLLGIEIKIDLRGRFPTYVEAMRWLWNSYRSRLNPFLCDSRNPALAAYATFDTAYQWRGLMFWLTGPEEAARPGVNPVEELKLFDEIFATLGSDPVCTGFPAMEPGFGIGEPEGVALFSRFGMALSCTNHRSNFSIHSAMPVKQLHQPQQTPPPRLDRSKIYIALALSDGDNQILWPVFFRKYFEHEAFGTFPLAIGIGPATREMQPGIIEWYYEHAPCNTEFIADVSGAGYINPATFGSSLSTKESAWKSYLQWTARLMNGMELKTVRTVGGEDDLIERYINALPFCHSIFADMGRYSGRSGIKDLTYSLGGKPVFRAVTSWRYGKEGFLKEVYEQVGEQRPAFVNGFVHCWTFTMDDLVRIQKSAPDEVVFVTPSQLAELYRQSLSADQPQ